MNIIGIDFEYANNTIGSICAYGLAFENGSLEHSFVKPHPDCPEQRNTRYHRITQEETDSGIDFIKLYRRIESLNKTGDVVFVAHDLKSDRRAWLAALRMYGLPSLKLSWVDSLRVARKELGVRKNEGGGGVAMMAKRYGLEINHHNPADDAFVSLEVMKRNPFPKDMIVKD